MGLFGRCLLLRSIFAPAFSSALTTAAAVSTESTLSATSVAFTASSSSATELALLLLGLNDETIFVFLGPVVVAATTSGLVCTALSTESTLTATSPGAFSTASVSAFTTASPLSAVNTITTVLPLTTVLVSLAVSSVRLASSIFTGGSDLAFVLMLGLDLSGLFDGGGGGNWSSDFLGLLNLLGSGGLLLFGGLCSCASLSFLLFGSGFGLLAFAFLLGGNGLYAVGFSLGNLGGLGLLCSLLVEGLVGNSLVSFGSL